MKSWMVMVFILGVLIGALFSHLRHQERLHDQIKAGVERTIKYNLRTDSKGNVYYYIDK